ncbi:MAG: phosphotransferase [Actinopolymorphaceae bacterium]
MDDPVTPEPTAVVLKVLSAWEGVIGRAEVDPLHADADRVWAVRGEDGREYVLKKILPLDPEAPLTRLVAEYRVLTHLHAAGVPVAVPLVTDEGHIHGGDEPDLYTLSPRIRATADTPETRPDAAAVYARIGGAIGLLHKALERCPFAIRSYEIIPAERLSSAYWPILRAADTSLAGKVDRLLPHLCETLADLPST